MRRAIGVVAVQGAEREHSRSSHVLINGRQPLAVPLGAANLNRNIAE
jgi:hypothetical protein